MKAAIYARTATADKSTDAQIAACRAIAESNGYHVSQIFSETGQLARMWNATDWRPYFAKRKNMPLTL